VHAGPQLVVSESKTLVRVFRVGGVVVVLCGSRVTSPVPVRSRTQRVSSPTPRRSMNTAISLPLLTHPSRSRSRMMLRETAPARRTRIDQEPAGRERCSSQVVGASKALTVAMTRSKGAVPRWPERAPSARISHQSDTLWQNSGMGHHRLFPLAVGSTLGASVLASIVAGYQSVPSALQFAFLLFAGVTAAVAGAAAVLDSSQKSVVNHSLLEWK
jgi:hypothetical protein